jgi:hypothetical protein
MNDFIGDKGHIAHDTFGANVAQALTQATGALCGFTQIGNLQRIANAGQR